MLSEKWFFILLGFGLVSYYFSIYRAYSYSKQKGYNPSFGFTWPEYREFIRFLFEKSKENNDTILKIYLVLIYLSFGLCTATVLIFAFS
jgi:hypothetical protein